MIHLAYPGIAPFAKVCEVISRLYPGMRINSVSTLLFVGLHPEGVSVSEVAQHVGTNLATASRNVGALAEGYQHGGKTMHGYRLLEVTTAPDDARRKVVKVTPKGKALLDYIIGEFMDSRRALVA